MLLLLVALSVTATPRLGEARRQAEAFQYDKAVKTIEAALQQPDLDRESLLGLTELLGVCWGTLDKPARARQAFQVLLSLAPEHTLSRNLPPRVRTPYFEARGNVARLGGVTLAARPAVRVEGRLTSLEVVATDNAWVPARAVRFTLQADGGPPVVQVVPLGPERRARVTLDALGVDWSAELLGERGAVLQRLQQQERPPPPPLELPPAPPPPPPVVAAPAPATWLRPVGFTAAGVGVAALATGAVFGWQSASARDRLATAARDPQGVVTGLTQREAASLDQAARVNATVANALFIGGGVLAAAGVVLVVVGVVQDAPPPPVTVLVSPAGLTLSGRF